MTVTHIVISVTTPAFNYTYIPIIVGIVTGIILHQISLVKAKKSSRDNYLSPKLWDNTDKFKKIFNTKNQIIILVILSIELIMLFEGLTLLFWLF